MPHPNAINPKTGKRYSFVDPRQQEHDDKAIATGIQILERQKCILASQHNLLAYTRFTMPDPAAPNDVTRSRYEAEQFHELTAEVLRKLVYGELTFDDGSVCKQLIFCMPPRHGKTELATKRLAAWVSGKYPQWDVAVASYSDTMATDMGADTRAILTSPQHRQVFPDYKLRRGGTAKDNIQTIVGGRLVFVGRGGALTGRGMHVGLGDDLFKDHEEARSPAIRDQAWNWFTKVFMTRRMGRKLVILTMTRWHSDDIIGRLTDPENPHYNPIEAKKWKIIRLPALAEDDDPLKRPLDQALWPARFDEEFLRSQQRLDPLGFAALYQQSPTVADGTLYRRENIRRYRAEDLPTELRYYAASDHAVAIKQRNDPSCFGKVGIDQHDNMYFTELLWKRIPSDQAAEAMLTMATGKTAPILWWAEKGHISQSIGPFLRKLSLETGRYINLREITPAVDLEQRSQSFAARVASGKVFFPQGMQWDKAIEELLAVPSGTHDDFAAMCAILGLGLRSQFGAKAKPKPKPQPEFGTLAWVKQADKWKTEQAELAAGRF